MDESNATADTRRKSGRSAVTRRRVLRTSVTTVAAVSGTAAALRPMLTKGQPTTDDAPGARGAAAPVALGVDTTPALFDEVYRGRRIQGFPDSGEEGMSIRIDGRPLHVMRRFDGTWISMADHYQPYATPLATARGAVDVIGRAELSMYTEHHH